MFYIATWKHSHDSLYRESGRFLYVVDLLRCFTYSKFKSIDQRRYWRCELWSETSISITVSWGLQCFTIISSGSGMCTLHSRECLKVFTWPKWTVSITGRDNSHSCHDRSSQDVKDKLFPNAHLHLIQNCVCTFGLHAPGCSSFQAWWILSWQLQVWGSQGSCVWHTDARTQTHICIAGPMVSITTSQTALSELDGADLSRSRWGAGESRQWNLWVKAPAGSSWGLTFCSAPLPLAATSVMSAELNFSIWSSSATFLGHIH